MTGAVVGAALLTNMILVNSVRASDRGWEHLMAEREWEENIALLKDGMIKRDKKLQQNFSSAVNNLDGKIEDLKGGFITFGSLVANLVENIENNASDPTKQSNEISDWGSGNDDTRVFI